MKRRLENTALALTLLCAAGCWIGFPRLAFLAGCAADVSVHVAGERFFWMIPALPLVAFLLLKLGLKREDAPDGNAWKAAALLSALTGFLAMANLYWQYHCCEVPFVEISNNLPIS